MFNRASACAMEINEARSWHSISVRHVQTVSERMHIHSHCGLEKSVAINL